MRTLFSKIAFVAMLCALLFSSCTSDIEPPPFPPDNPISSSVQVWSYCVYPEIQGCYSGSYSACPGIGGELRNDCPYSNSNPVQSSSGGNTVGNSSSSQAGQGNSSGGTAQEYNYCVFAAERNCLTGPLTLCPPGGELSNTCPYNSSSSSLGGGNLSSDVQQVYSSSSIAAVVVSSSSSLGGGNLSSDVQQVYSSSSIAAVVVSSSSSLSFGSPDSESKELGTFDVTYFTDPRDGEKYKYEIDPNSGRIWLKENLRYSRGNTLGWCYVVNGKTLGTAGADLSGCDSPHGRNYTYDIAMDGNSSRGLCPVGWHIPSTDEWAELGAGTAASTAGTRKMSNDFYVYSGNYDAAGYEGRAQGWYERDKNGFYWTNKNRNTFVMMGGTGSNRYFYSKSDATNNEYYSIRCIADKSTTIKFPPSEDLEMLCKGDVNNKSCYATDKATNVLEVENNSCIKFSVDWTNSSDSPDIKMTCGGNFPQSGSTPPKVSISINVDGKTSNVTDSFSYVSNQVTLIPQIKVGAYSKYICVSYTTSDMHPKSLTCTASR